MSDTRVFFKIVNDLQVNLVTEIKPKVSQDRANLV